LLILQRGYENWTWQFIRGANLAHWNLHCGNIHQ
jgi:hypothetical protein